MKFGMICLDGRNRYLVNGMMPFKHKDDKEFLRRMVGATTTRDNYWKLPKSLRDTYLNESSEGIAFEIPSIGQSDVILVSRTKDARPSSQGDKKFRFDGYRKANLTIEVWFKEDKK